VSALQFDPVIKFGKNTFYLTFIFLQFFIRQPISLLLQPKFSTRAVFSTFPTQIVKIIYFYIFFPFVLSVSADLLFLILQ
jgi:hypothetical protein